VDNKFNGLRSNVIDLNAALAVGSSYFLADPNLILFFFTQSKIIENIS